MGLQFNYVHSQNMERAAQEFIRFCHEFFYEEADSLGFFRLNTFIPCVVLVDGSGGEAKILQLPIWNCNRLTWSLSRRYKYQYMHPKKAQEPDQLPNVAGIWL
jgi:hypothetical protein